MGLISKSRKKFVSHKKRWDKKVIVDEAVLVTDYALKNKKEIRKVELLIAKYKKIAKELNKTVLSKESEEALRFLAKLKSNGFLSPEAVSLDEVLDIKVRDVLERRLSNIVYKHKFARTPEQARQFVVHGHIVAGDRLITSPSYLVGVEEELTIGFSSKSSLADENHPERKIEVEQIPELASSLEEEKGAKTRISREDDKEALLDDEESDEVKE